MAEQQTETIPPLAHFIWAGGQKNMVQDGIQIVGEWIKDNQSIDGFQAWLWIDKKTAAKNVVENYKEFFRKQGITVIDEDDIGTKININEIPQPFVILKDIQKNGLRDEFVTYEIEKLRPNYGSSSDLLRYKILLKHGGFYGDCTDVSKGKDGLRKLFQQKFSRPVIYIEHCPQRPDPPQSDLAKFDVKQIGNDTFAVTPKNIAILKFIIESQRKYELSDALTFNHIIVAHSGNNIKDITIGRTGPGLVRHILLGEMGCKEENGVLIDKDRKIEVRRIRDGQQQLVTPKKNTANWLNTRITEYNNIDEAIKAVINTINFEAKHFKILRLDDHISDLIKSIGGKIQVKVALEALDKTIQENAKNIKYVQLTGEFDETISYCNSQLNSIMHFFNLPNKESCFAAIQAQAFLNDFVNAENFARQNPQVYKKILEEKKISVECCAIYVQRQEVKEQLCVQIDLGLEFMANLIKNLHKFQNQSLVPDIINFLKERLGKYKEYADVLNPDVESKYKVDIKRIDALLDNLSTANRLQATQFLDNSNKK